MQIKGTITKNAESNAKTCHRARLSIRRNKTPLVIIIVDAKVTTMIGQLAIPLLQEGQSIGDWEPVFTASVTPLLIRDDGQKLAVDLLPAYVCRRTAEIELVREA